MQSIVEPGTKQFYMKQVAAMEAEVSTFVPHWQDLQEFISPRKGRFFTTDRNRGDKRYGSIINNRASWALRVARSGMLAGVASPARPWFKLNTLTDPELMKFKPVAEWLYDAERLMYAILGSGNFYSEAPKMLGELMQFGTGFMEHEDDFDDVARFYTHTVGSFYIAQNDKYKVDTLARKFQMTTLQMVKKFGKENCNQAVKTAYDRGDYTAWHDVIQYVAPNDDYRPSNALSRYKRFKSVYFQPGGMGDDQNKFLRQKGFDRFPGYSPRWDVTGEDIYGTDCPGMMALGDIRGLQSKERYKGQGIAKMVNPPLRGPAALKNVNIKSIPGGATLYDSSDEKSQLSAVYMVNPQLGEMRQDIEMDLRRIDDAFYINLFRAISNMEGIQPRNELDLRLRDQERLLELGPVLINVHDDWLSPTLDSLFDQCQDAKLFRPPPPELENQVLKIEYISALAMAQRSVDAGAIERLAGFIGGLCQNPALAPAAAKKFNVMRAIDDFAEATGASPRLVIADDVVNEQMAAEAQQAQMMQMAEMAPGVAGSIKDLAAAGQGAAK